MTEIFFESPKHRANYEHLKEKFSRIDFARNQQYRSTCYIAALPEIAKCYSLRKQENGPFDWLFDYLDDPDDFIKRSDRGETTGTTAPLTGQTWALCKIALSLWNGHECDISDITDMDSQLYIVVLQALDLSRRRPSLDYTQYAITRVDDGNDIIFRKTN